MKIPKQLQNTEFRFFKIKKDSKIPMERGWNKEGGSNYPFFHEKILEWLKEGNNYGVLCGCNNLIVLDFDNKEFYDSIAYQLPPTFTVLSAGKRLPHMYYLLSAEDTMFKKIAIMGKDKKVICDIMADRCPIVGPGSKIDRKYYNVSNDRNIATISRMELSTAFGDLFKPRQKKEYTGPTKNSPEKVEKAIKVMELIKVRRTGDTLFECPFHLMAGKGNLSVMENGRIWCFHENRLWYDVFDFADEVCSFRGDTAMQDMIQIMRRDNNGS